MRRCHFVIQLDLVAATIYSLSPQAGDARASRAPCRLFRTGDDGKSLRHYTIPTPQKRFQINSISRPGSVHIVESRPE